MANHLAEQEIPVITLGIENNLLHPHIRRESSPHCLKTTHVVIFPLPMTTSPNTVNAPFSPTPLLLDRCFGCISPMAVVFGGKILLKEKKLAQQFGLSPADYLEREELAVLNAVPTAEGALALAISHSPVTLWGSACLITGFGRIGRVLALRLSALGAQITVAARSPQDLAWAKAMGFASLPLHQLSAKAAQQDFIFNTIPALIFHRDILQQLKKSCLLLDLASQPGGVSWEDAHSLGVHAVAASGLPGKTAPATAALAIEKTIFAMLEETPTPPSSISATKGAH